MDAQRSPAFSGEVLFWCFLFSIFSYSICDGTLGHFGYSSYAKRGRMQRTLSVSNIGEGEEHETIFSIVSPL